MGMAILVTFTSIPDPFGSVPIDRVALLTGSDAF